MFIYTVYVLNTKSQKQYWVINTDRFFYENNITIYSITIYSKIKIYIIRMMHVFCFYMGLKRKIFREATNPVTLKARQVTIVLL